MTAPDSEPDPGRRTETPPPAPPHQIRPSRLGGLWIAMTCGAVILFLLLIFILENSHSVDIAYFGVHGHVPLGVALLLAAVFGVLLVVVPGAGRMIQLRLAARRHRQQDEAAAGAADPAVPATSPAPVEWPGRPDETTEPAQGPHSADPFR